MCCPFVGRFLEHSRVFRFGSGPEATYLLGSADLMERNLDRRVKVLTPIRDPSLRERLDKILEILLADAMSDSELREELLVAAMAPWRSTGSSRCRSARDLQREQGRASAADERGDVVPVDAAGELGRERPRDAETPQLVDTPLLNLQLLLVVRVVIDLRYERRTHFSSGLVRIRANDRAEDACRQRGQPSLSDASHRASRARPERHDGPIRPFASANSTSSARVSSLSLRMMWARCVSTVRTEMKSFLPISWFV